MACRADVAAIEIDDRRRECSTSPSITVTYFDFPNATVPGTSIELVIAPGEGYRHDDKRVREVMFVLGSVVADATIVTRPFASALMIEQRLTTVYEFGDPAPITLTWECENSVIGPGTFRIGIPSGNEAGFSGTLAQGKNSAGIIVVREA